MKILLYSLSYLRMPALIGLLSLSSCGYEGMGASLLNNLGVPVSEGDLKTAGAAGGQLVKAARGFTDEQEYYLGRGVSATILGRYKALHKPAVNTYITKVGLVLAGYSDRPATFGGYHFEVLDTEEINALSAPGGFIFITKGLLRVIPDEDALAAVLAHEIAHVVKGHGTGAISQANLTSALTLLGKQAAASQGGEVGSLLTASFGDSIKDITDTLLTKGYSRSQEYSADEYAASLMSKAGYDSGALLTMLQSVEKFGASKGSGGWMSTHPGADDRIDEVESSIALALPELAQNRLTRAKRFTSNVKLS